jgi:hypothetical protein
MHLVRHARILNDAAAAEFNFQHAAACVVADRTNVSRVDAFAFHIDPLPYLRASLTMPSSNFSTAARALTDDCVLAGEGLR